MGEQGKVKKNLYFWHFLALFWYFFQFYKFFSDFIFTQAKNLICKEIKKIN